MRTGVLLLVTVLLAGADSALAGSLPSLSLDVCDAAPAPAAANATPTPAVVPAAPPPPVAGPECAASASRFWVSGDYLLWWTKDGPLAAPLVSTGTTSSAGRLGRNGTAVLVGDDFDYGTASGGRVAAGVWLDDCQTWGVQGSGFLLEDRLTGSAFASGPGGTPVLARPELNAQTGRETAELVSFPTAFAGSIAVASSSRLWGAEADLVRNLWSAPTSSVGVLVGFRYLDLDEGLDVFQTSEVLGRGVSGFNGTPVIDPNRLTILDAFDARNQFYGGQVGARAQLRQGRASLDLTGKVALGATHQALDIGGNTTLTRPSGVTATVPGGLLALGTNSGRTERNEFAVVPEVEVRLAYQLTPALSAYVGYSFLYWSDVARPGDQVDHAVNRTQLPTSLGFGPLVGPARPALPFRETDFWAQGANFGLAYRY